MRLLGALGAERVLMDTVGVGQSEMAVRDLADASVAVDILLVAKAVGANAESTRALAAELKRALELRDTAGWTEPALAAPWWEPRRADRRARPTVGCAPSGLR